MADIAPFYGIRFDPARLDDLSRVVAPPYDVISSEEQSALYASSPCNIVRIILNRPEAGDGPTDRHERAAREMQRLLDAGVLVEDREPALYLYRQEFTAPLDGRRLERWGVVAALRLAPYSDGIVLPHEFTRGRALEDRLELMRTTRANTEPIMLLYEDPGLTGMRGLRDAIAGTPPLLTATVEGDLHQVWALADGPVVRAFATSFQDRPVWIADGHHRYETALTYRYELASAGRPILGADRLLVTLLPFEDPGIVVLPTHRMVTGLGALAIETLEADLDRYFHRAPVESEDVPGRLASMRSVDGSFLVAGANGVAHCSLKDAETMTARAADRGRAWRELDVSILQTLILDPMAALGGSVSYTRHLDEALQAPRSGAGAVSFLLGAPSARDLRAVAAEGDRMPPKSTYFEPKLWSGLLMRRLDR